MEKWDYFFISFPNLLVMGRNPFLVVSIAVGRRTENRVSRNPTGGIADLGKLNNSATGVADGLERGAADLWGDSASGKNKKQNGERHQFPHVRFLKKEFYEALVK